VAFPGVTQSEPERPVDVDTGFGLWLTALPLLVTGRIVDTALAPSQPVYIYAFAGLFLVLVSAVVITFLLLMRRGYRWARTVLTSGGLATIAFTAVSLFSVQRETVDAVTYAVTGIVGSVLICGGAYLLHRKDAHAYFTR
jgi:hypothetical protein